MPPITRELHPSVTPSGPQRWLISKQSSAGAHLCGAYGCGQRGADSKVNVSLASFIIGVEARAEELQHQSRD